MISYIILADYCFYFYFIFFIQVFIFIEGLDKINYWVEMLVSALLTSVGINSGLCVLFFTLYSILRKQPSNYEVYVPRLLAKGSSNRRRRFNLEMLIPSAGWVSRAWKHSEEDLLESSGLDAVVFMRVITFRYFSLVTSNYFDCQRVERQTDLHCSIALVLQRCLEFLC